MQKHLEENWEFKIKRDCFKIVSFIWEKIRELLDVTRWKKDNKGTRKAITVEWKLSANV